MVFDAKKLWGKVEQKNVTFVMFAFLEPLQAKHVQPSSVGQTWLVTTVYSTGMWLAISWQVVSLLAMA